jgi:trehalose 6-phosphate synthase
MGLYDVLMVNSIFDGMNLVAKEGAVLNRNRGVILLSRHAGAIEEMQRFAVPIDPLDIGGTADALAQVLEMSDEERGRRAQGLRRAAARRTPAEWVEQQLADLEAAVPTPS